MIFEKIGPQHLERKAILYVRQSSAHQVLHNRESSALQYAMRDRLVALGWSSIETVDEVVSVGCELVSVWRHSPFERHISGDEALPLGQGGRAAKLVGLAVDEMAF